MRQETRLTTRKQRTTSPLRFSASNNIRRGNLATSPLCSTSSINMTSSNQNGWDRKYTLKEADLHEKKLADDIGVGWRDLARALGFNESSIDTIEKEKNNCDKECCIRVLVTWLHKEGEDATAEKIFETLVKIERKSLAERFPRKPSDPSQNPEAVIHDLEEKLAKMSARSKELEAEFDKMRVRNKALEDEVNEMSARNKKLENEIQKNKAVLETVAVAVQEMEKKPEQRRQESLRWINSEVQELLQQLKRVDVDNTDKSLVFSIEPKNDLLCHDAKVPQQDEVHLLQSCKEQLSLYQGIFDAFKKLIPEVGELKDYNFECIKKLCNFTKELKEQEQLFSSKIESLNSLKDNLNEDQTAELEKLVNWYNTHQRQVDGLERLLSSLLSQGRSTKNQRSKPDSSKHSQSLRELQNISSPSISAPFCPRIVCTMNTNKKPEEGQSICSINRSKSETSAQKPKKQNDETTRPASYSSPGGGWKDIPSTKNKE